MAPLQGAGCRPPMSPVGRAPFHGSAFPGVPIQGMEYGPPMPHMRGASLPGPVAPCPGVEYGAPMPPMGGELSHGFARARPTMPQDLGVGVQERRGRPPRITNSTSATSRTSQMNTSIPADSCERSDIVPLGDSDEQFLVYSFAKEQRNWGDLSQDGLQLTFRFPRFIVHGYEHQFKLSVSIMDEGGAGVLDHEIVVKFFMGAHFCYLEGPDGKKIPYEKDYNIYKSFSLDDVLRATRKMKSRGDIYRHRNSYMWCGWDRHELERMKSSHQHRDAWTLLGSVAFLLPIKVNGQDKQLRFIWRRHKNPDAVDITHPGLRYIKPGEVMVCLCDMGPYVSTAAQELWSWDFFDKEKWDFVSIRDVVPKPLPAICDAEALDGCVPYEGKMSKKTWGSVLNDGMAVEFFAPVFLLEGCSHTIDFCVTWKGAGSQCWREYHQLRVSLPYSNKCWIKYPGSMFCYERDLEPLEPDMKWFLWSVDFGPFMNLVNDGCAAFFLPRAQDDQLPRVLKFLWTMFPSVPPRKSVRRDANVLAPLDPQQLSLSFSAGCDKVVAAKDELVRWSWGNEMAESILADDNQS